MAEDQSSLIDTIQDLTAQVERLNAQIASERTDHAQHIVSIKKIASATLASRTDLLGQTEQRAARLEALLTEALPVIDRLLETDGYGDSLEDLVRRVTNELHPSTDLVGVPGNGQTVQEWADRIYYGPTVKDLPGTTEADL